MEGSSSMDFQRTHHFFKIFHHTLHSNQLQIPKGFLKHMKGETSSLVSLVGPSGRVWKVGLIKHNNGIFLEEGWPVFLMDHSIQTADFFIFRYCGNLQFEVRIFDQTACQKKSAFVAVCSQDNVTNAPRAKRGSIRRGAPLLTMEEAIRRASMSSRGLLSQRRKVTVEETERAIQKAKKFRSTYPFLTLIMPASSVYFGFYVHLPRTFCESHLPQSSQEVVLRDPSGREWHVHYYVGARRTELNRGWAAFSEHNNIEAEDVCVFEVTNRNEMRVHIFRVVEEIRPLVKNVM